MYQYIDDIAIMDTSMSGTKPPHTLPATSYSAYMEESNGRCTVGRYGYIDDIAIMDTADKTDKTAMIDKRRGRFVHLDHIGCGVAQGLLHAPSNIHRHLHRDRLLALPATCHSLRLHLGNYCARQGSHAAPPNSTWPQTHVSSTSNSRLPVAQGCWRTCTCFSAGKGAPGMGERAREVWFHTS